MYGIIKLCHWNICVENKSYWLPRKYWVDPKYISDYRQFCTYKSRKSAETAMKIMQLENNDSFTYYVTELV